MTEGHARLLDEDTRGGEDFKCVKCDHENLPVNLGKMEREAVVVFEVDGRGLDESVVDSRVEDLGVLNDTVEEYDECLSAAGLKIKKEEVERELREVVGMSEDDVREDLDMEMEAYVDDMRRAVERVGEEVRRRGERGGEGGGDQINLRSALANSALWASHLCNGRAKRTFRAGQFRVRSCA